MITTPIDKPGARHAAVAVWRLSPTAALRQSLASASDYLALTKPRVMALAVFTGVVGLFAAPGRIGPVTALLAVLCIAMGAAAAGALNMWYDADIDRLMSRTAARPVPRGRISPRSALLFGTSAAIVSVVLLATIANVTAAALLAFTVLFYIGIYTVWLKRSTPQSIVIGGAAGAMPPVIGWTVVTGQVGLEPLILFLIIFCWTPPHFWALAIVRAGDYRRAKIPALPVVAGEQATIRQIVGYTTLLVPISLLPWFLGFATPVYGAVAITVGAVMLVLAMGLARSSANRRRTAGYLFAFSISYLVFLFAALLFERIVL